MGIRLLFSTLLIGYSLTGCANLFKYQPYARSVKKRPGKGGVIALLLNHRQEDQEKAKQLMIETCGKQSHEIIEEGEFVIGTITNSNAEQEAPNKRKVGSLFGIPVTSGHDGKVNTTSETIQKKEWHLKYRCK